MPNKEDQNPINESQLSSNQLNHLSPQLHNDTEQPSILTSEKELEIAEEAEKPLPKPNLSNSNLTGMKLKKNIKAFPNLM